MSYELDDDDRFAEVLYALNLPQGDVARLTDVERRDCVLLSLPGRPSYSVPARAVPAVAELLAALEAFAVRK